MRITQPPCSLTRDARRPGAGDHAADGAGTFDPARAAVIDRGLQRYVDSDRVPGIVALVLQDGQVVYEKAFGWADKEAGRRMTTDTIFRIASQTKALTSAAIMQLVEDGSLTLNTRAGALHSFLRADDGGGGERTRRRSRRCRRAARSRFAIC